MNLGSIAIIAVIALWFIISLVYSVRKKGGGCSGCSGDCSACQNTCKKNNDVKS